MIGDALAETPVAEGLGIAQAPVGQRRMGGGNHGGGRRGAGLADLHVDDPLAGVFAIGGGAHHVHDDERFDDATPGRIAGAAGHGRMRRIGLAAAGFTSITSW